MSYVDSKGCTRYTNEDWDFEELPSGGYMEMYTSLRADGRGGSMNHGTWEPFVKIQYVKDDKTYGTITQDFDEDTLAGNIKVLEMDLGVPVEYVVVPSVMDMINRWPFPSEVNSND